MGNATRRLPTEPEPRVETLQKVFKTLSDPTRVRVLALL
jgi:DNA-binding transcriptional ArsR family regulator